MARTIAVLAVQGAFAEHEARLRELGANVVELRQAADLEQDFDGLVLPGGESTTQAKLLHELGMFDELKRRIEDGMPVLATCAGLILLASRIEGTGDLAGLDPAAAKERLAVRGFGTLDVTVERNAYGRQLGSFHTEGHWTKEACEILEQAAGGSPANGVNFASVHSGAQTSTCANHQAASDVNKPLPLTFIRAPRITKLGTNAQTLIEHDGYPVAVLQGKQIGVAFHPELDSDQRLHQLFLSL